MGDGQVSILDRAIVSLLAGDVDTELTPFLETPAIEAHQTHSDAAALVSEFHRPYYVLRITARGDSDQHIPFSEMDL